MRPNILIDIYRLIFSVLLLVIVNESFFIFIYKWLLIYLIKYLHKIFYLKLFFYVQKHVEKTCISNKRSLIKKVCDYIIGSKNIFCTCYKHNEIIKP
jgi:hypothetical protein